MLKSKSRALILSALSLCLLLPLHANASFGSGTAVIAEDLCLLKSGRCGEKICFGDTDFKAALGIPDFSQITIKSIPDESHGVLIYAGKKVKMGQEIRRRNIPSLVFIPSSDKVKEACFSFCVKGFADEEEIKCILKFSAYTSTSPNITSPINTVFMTKDSGNYYGSLSANDPEGDDIEFLVAEYPKRGVLKMSRNGEFLYTPHAMRRGSDSFAYVVRDEWGNWSRPERFEISME